MIKKYTLRWLITFALLIGWLIPAAGAAASLPEVKSAQASKVTAFDLIVAMNTLRTSYGLPALVEDPIIDAVAQSTAATMAAQQMTWHIGNVSGRVQSAGYGGGSKVWATENFAAGNYDTIDQIMIVWSDASHMIPAVNAAYCNIGAGEAKSPNGMTYYVLQAAYTAGKSCGEYKSAGGVINPGVGSTTGNRAGGGSQLVVPVKIATPDADGKIYHVVEAGQSFWSIAIAYKITIKDLKTWNNLSNTSILKIGERLFIPGSNTAGYATPTPVGMVQVSPPDQDGKIIHTVQLYQTLSTISQAYGITVDTLTGLNGIQVDWPLQIGQKLIISRGNVTPSPTPRPLTPLEKLTPASDGKYYHIVKSGETLSWIASLYKVTVSDLMAWNDLTDASLIKPNQKLLLEVTPPATQTPVPALVTITPTLTFAPPTPTATITLTPSLAPTASSSPPVPIPAPGQPSTFWWVILGLAASGLVMILIFFRRK